LNAWHAEGRLTTGDWRHYDGVHCVFRPKQMTPDVLEAGCHWAWQVYYSIPSIARRILKPGDKLLEIATNMYFNWAYRRMVNRLPRGALTPLGKIFDRLQEQIVPYRPGTADGMREDDPGLQIQLGRDHLRFSNTIEVHLEGVLDGRVAYPLQERINTLGRTAGSDLFLHLGHLTTVTPKAVRVLLEGTRKTFKQRRVQLILQEVDASLYTWLCELPVPSHATVITANSQGTATGS
jgi:hypothetical protein